MDADPIRWAVRWHRGIMWHACLPLLFQTRRECRAYIEKEYGYIKRRPDLRAEPHNWRMPVATSVRVILREVHRGR